MAAFGDTSPPLSSSVSILEEITLDYLTDLIHRSRPSPYTLPISTSKFNPSHPLNHLIDESTGLEIGPSNLNAPTGRSGYAYPSRAKISVDDIRRALRKEGEGARVVKRKREEDGVEEEAVLNRRLERLEEILYLQKMLAEAQKGTSNDISDLFAVGNSKDDK